MSMNVRGREIRCTGIFDDTGRARGAGGSLARAVCPHCGHSIFIHIPDRSGLFKLNAVKSPMRIRWQEVKDTGEIIEGEQKGYIRLHVWPPRAR
ncbi:MAG: hypothetical protein A2Y60_00730 [Chloroflexi bacterium RBG_13_54_9]|nr:MAG: hypothetical protein A2Y60_00730 [Chloroflexi bacterium RBG_13_54_9]